MKHILKYSLLAFALLVTAASCTDSYEYDPAQPVAEGCEGVSFLTDVNEIPVAVDETSFVIKMGRTETAGELTVPLIVDAPEELNVPSSVTFANGSSEAEIVVTLSNSAEFFKKYDLKISLPEEYVNPYDTNVEGFMSFSSTVVKNDYKPFAKGVFTENILFGQSWQQLMEYSELMDMYRLPDLIADGTHFYFKWDGTGDDDQEFYFCDSEGNETATIATGYIHSAYGMISANVLSGYFVGYDGGTFYFPWSMTVDAGSFGSDYDTFTITEIYN